VREISQALELNLATCYHLLNTLEHEGFLQRDSTRRIRLGHRVGELHDAFEAMLKPDALLIDHLDALNLRTGETSYLGIWDGDDVVSVAVREGRGGVRVQGLYLGYRGHAYARALARALLAYREKAFLDTYLSRTELEPLTEHTVTDPDAFRQLLADARTRGFAVEREEFTPGVCCVGAPVFDAGGQAIAALSVSIPRARFEHEGDTITSIVVDEADNASHALQEHQPGRGQEGAQVAG
jgi:DNA-binding IclR family transcriptional regulator